MICDTALAGGAVPGREIPGREREESSPSERGEEVNEGSNEGPTSEHRWVVAVRLAQENIGVSLPCSPSALSRFVSPPV